MNTKTALLILFCICLGVFTQEFEISAIIALVIYLSEHIAHFFKSDRGV